MPWSILRRRLSPTRSSVLSPDRHPQGSALKVLSSLALHTPDSSHICQRAAAVAAAGGRTQAGMEDKLLAALCMTALDVALEEWQADTNSRALDALIDQALSTVGSLR